MGQRIGFAKEFFKLGKATIVCRMVLSILVLTNVDFIVIIFGVLMLSS